jgi:hypothetical protein
MKVQLGLRHLRQEAKVVVGAREVRFATPLLT